MESNGGTGYAYAVVHDGADETADPLHEVPFDRLEHAQAFALDWLAQRRTTGARLAVVRVQQNGRRDTVTILDPFSADVQSELERRRGA